MFAIAFLGRVVQILCRSVCSLHRIGSRSKGNTRSLSCWSLSPPVMPLRTGELEAGPKRAAINTGRAILKGAPFSRPKRRAWVAPKQEFIDHVNAVSHQLKKRQKQRRCVFIPGQSPWLPWSDLLTFAALGTRIHAARKSKASLSTRALPSC